MKTSMLTLGHLVIALLAVQAQMAQCALTPVQLASVVIIEADKGSGTGFVSTFKGKNYIITNQHVLKNATKITIKNSDGVKFKGASFIAATDRDIVLIGVAELPPGIVPLPLAADSAKTAKVGDATLIPGNSKGDGVITETPGTVLAFGPQRIEVSNPVFAGNSGSPIIHQESGEVIGVLTEAELVQFDKFTAAAFKNVDSQITKSIRFFGHRIDLAKGWESMDWRLFCETSKELQKGRRELEAVFNFLRDKDANTWKEFSELHATRNRATAILNADAYSQGEKQAARTKFVSAIEWLCRSPVSRMQNRKLYYIHRDEMDQIMMLSMALREGCEILRKDIRLINELVQHDSST